MLGLVLADHHLLALFELIGQRHSTVDPHRPRAAGVAEQAAGQASGAAPVGTGETGIDGNLVHPAAEPLLQMLGKKLVAFFAHGGTMPSVAAPRQGGKPSY